ncbi:MAG: purine-nucleoside phosphorylase [Candidatus Omnitrophica bacterium]|nr:purine-nucleoside phosphorylase [Candidatus Omnitrophota bacterium]
MTLHAQLQETLRVLKPRLPRQPHVALVLGSGLGGVTQSVTTDAVIPYAEVPHLPRSTAPGHAGQLVAGRVGATPVLIFEGRCHYYEGYTLEQVTYPIRLIQALGIPIVLLSNVSGGLNPAFAKGDLMLIEDHINLMGVNPLIGANDDRLGLRFPDMAAPYDARLLSLAEQVARQELLPIRRGVYAALTGPNLETRAEYRMLRQLGADAVGMSTVPEVLVAVHAGLRILAVSLVTDICIPETLQPVNIEEILKVAAETEPKLSRLLTGVITRLDVRETLSASR